MERQSTTKISSTYILTNLHQLKYTTSYQEMKLSLMVAACYTTLLFQSYTYTIYIILARQASLSVDLTAAVLVV